MDRCADPVDELRPGFLAESDRIKSLAVHDVRAAIAAADRLVESARTHRERVRALSACAHARACANEFVAASADLHEATAVAETHALSDEIGPLLLVQVQPLARAGRLEQAEQAAERACREFAASGHDLMHGKALVNLGIVRRMRGGAEAALRCFDEAARLLEGDVLSLAAVHSNRAVALLELDRFDPAMDAFVSAMSLLQAADRGHAAAIVKGNIADLLARAGRIDDALVRFDEARELFVKAGAEADLARLDAEEAEALFAVGAHLKCVRLLDGCREALRRSGLVREYTRATLVYGLASMRAGNLSAAATALDEAKTHAASMRSSLILAEAGIALCELAAARGEIEQARRFGAEAVALLAERPVRRAVARIAMASVELDAGRTRDARVLLDAADADLGDAGAAPLRARALHLRSRVARQEGDARRALDLVCEAIAVVERFRGEIRAEQIRTAYLESTQRLFMDACELARVTLPIERQGAVVFDATERMRSRTLLDSLGSGGRRPLEDSNTDTPTTVEMNALYSSLGPTSADSPDVLERRRARLRALEARRDAAQDRAAARRSIDAASMLFSEPLTLDEAIGRIPEGEAVVSFYPDGPDVLAQVIRAGRRAEIRRLASRAEVSTQCRRFRLAVARCIAGINRRAEAAAVAALSELQGLLLRPLNDHLSVSLHVRLMPFGDLHGIPLHCAPRAHLALGDDSPTAVVSYLPGVTIGAALAEMSRATDASLSDRVVVVGLGDSVAPHIEAEAREVASCHRGATALVGGRATADAVLGAIRGAALVHLACHAVFDAEFPMSSRIKLADRWVTARELVGRFRPGAAVVVAGCDTGRTSDIGGEDRLGIVRAMLASGVGAVLAAAWPLHDASAAGLMVGVHRGLAEDPAGFARALPRCLAGVQRQMRDRAEPIDRWAGLYVPGALL